MNISLRKSRVVIKVIGPDAHKLLNDVLTGPMPVQNGKATWWALLSPQGKIQTEGLMGFADSAYWLDVDESVSESFFKRMRMYKLRADAEISIEDSVVGWSKDRPRSDAGIVHSDERAGGLGFRIIGKRDQNWTKSGQAFGSARVGAGICELGQDFETDTQFPHDIGMDLNGGIDFEKGCYIGQEVVSRMRHRGNIRRRPVIVSGLSSDERTLSVGEQDVGNIGNTVDGSGIGIVRIDRIANALAAQVDGASVLLALPLWASYHFADSDPN